MLIRANAPFYEAALIAAMSEGNETEAIKIIDCIRSYKGNNAPSLLYVDANGINFLTFALGENLRRVVKALIDTDEFNESQEILLGTNHKGQTLVCHAAELGYHEIVECFTHCSMNLLNKLPEDEQNKYHQFCLKPDKKGNTPLHYAARIRVSYLYQFILQLLENEPDKDELINARNSNHDTALHLAINAKGILNTELIDALLTAGADIHLLNKYRQSAFSKLLQHTPEEQIQCIRLLGDTNKKFILENYEIYLEHHPGDKNTKEAYFGYKSLYENLQNLVIANLEYNIQWEPRELYVQNGKTYNIRDVENLEFSKKLPLYASRLSQGIFGSSRRQIQKMLKEKELLEQDTQFFQQLIQDIELHIQDWTDRKPDTFRYKAAAIAIPVILWSGLAVGIGCCIYYGVQKLPEIYWLYDDNGREHDDVYAYNHTEFIQAAHYDCFNRTGWRHDGYNLTRFCDECCGHYNNQWAERTVPIGFGGGVGGFCVTLINWLGTEISHKKLWKYTPIVMIYDKEWVELVKSIQENIIQKFKRLSDDKLPTDGKKIADLAQKIHSLDSVYTQNDVIVIFRNILDLVRQIESDMEHSRKPFTQVVSQSQNSGSLDNHDNEPTESSLLLS